MYDATVSHAFSIYLIALEDCCFAVTSSSSDKLSSITSCYETQCYHKLFGGQLLVVLFHQLIDNIVIQLHSPDLGPRQNFIDYRLHRVLSQTPQCHVLQRSSIKASSKQK
ncbi:hypothetical protein AVEN_168289-1 [Araneus ventricosus]|uniref:Uncharacterized protein n=1 Tax=Araneus ventricosus TaxID=182803 RepID=A0A4Y2FXR9_ARAVE|nr:hypothetical protein AVEN_168289-1 [Araneus ventricosus]